MVYAQFKSGSGHNDDDIGLLLVMQHFVRPTGKLIFCYHLSLLLKRLGLGKGACHKKILTIRFYLEF